MASLLPVQDVQALAERVDRIRGEKEGSFKKGLKTGGQNLKSTAYGAAAAIGDVTGNDSLTNYGIEGFQDAQYEAGKHSEGAVTDITEARSASDFASWAAFSIASNLPTLAGIAATGGVGGAVGVGAAKLASKKALEAKIKRVSTHLVSKGMAQDQAMQHAARQVVKSATATALKRGAIVGATTASVGASTGEIASSQFEATGEMHGASAMAFGAIAGMIDTVPLIRLFGRVGIESEAVKKGLAQTVQAKLARGGKSLARQMQLEGGTEGVQTLLEQSAVDYAEGHLNLFTIEDLKELTNAIAAGALFGGMMGVPGAISESNRFAGVRNANDELDRLELEIANGEATKEGEIFSSPQETIAKAQKTIDRAQQEITEKMKYDIERGDESAFAEAQEAMKTLNNRFAKIREQGEAAQAALDAKAKADTNGTATAAQDTPAQPSAQQASSPKKAEPAAAKSEKVPDKPIAPDIKQKVVDQEPAQRGDALKLAVKNLPGDAEQTRLSLQQVETQIRNNGGASKMTSARKLALQRRLVDLESQEGDVLQGDGMPYKNEKAAARRLKKLGEGYEVVPIAHGFGVRKAQAQAAPTSQGTESTNNLANNLPTEELPKEPASKVVDKFKDAQDRAAFDKVLMRLSDDDTRTMATELGLDPDEVVEMDGDDSIIASDQLYNALHPQADLDAKANEAATSEQNDLPEPTQAQKEAGNYKLGHYKLHGLDISIENPAGSKRKGQDSQGKKWETEMRSHYGYVKGSEAIDGDHVDVFIGPESQNAELPVHVVDQVDPRTGKYDEAKVMIGYPDQKAAEAAYRENYDKDWDGLGAITEMPMAEFKEWVKSDAAKKPVAFQEAKPEPAKQTKKKAPAKPKQKKQPAGEPETGSTKKEPKGANNRVFTVDKAEAARAVLKAKLGQLNAGVDPEVMQAGITLAGYHIESGARSFAAYTNAMVDDLGDAIKPYLRGWYEAIRHNPELTDDEKAGMSSYADIEAGVDDSTIVPAEVVQSEPEPAVEQAPRVEKYFDAAEAAANSNDDIEQFAKIRREAGQPNVSIAELNTIWSRARETSARRLNEAFNKAAANSRNITQFANELTNSLGSDKVKQLKQDGELRSAWNERKSNGKSVSNSDSAGAGQTQRTDTGQAPEAGTATGTESGRDRRPTPAVEDSQTEDAGALSGNGDSGSASGVPADTKAGTGAQRRERRRGNQSGETAPTNDGLTVTTTKAAIVPTREGVKTELTSKETEVIADSTATGLKVSDFVLTDPKSIVGGTPVKRFDKNREALELLEILTDKERQATPAEQAVLAGYTGWGSFGQELFQGTWERPRHKEQWDKRGTWLRETMGQSAWESAQRSITTSHYTDPPTVKAMWDIVHELGFRGGRIQEPAMGTGNFFSMMPDSVREKSTLTGIELDETTGAIAKQLFPQSNISIKNFRDAATPDDFYDLVIGNWPFENTPVADRRYFKEKPFLHDYFFLKALDQTRPGGLVVGITSKGTMDKKDTTIRRRLSEKAELVTAFRLPSGAFKEYAGTSVVTDIIVLKKRDEAEALTSDNWIGTADVDTPSGEKVTLNQYYIDNPKNVLGTIDFGNGTTYGRAGMIVNRPKDMQKALDGAVASVPKDIMQDAKERISYITNQTDERVGALSLQDGELIVSYGEQARKADEVNKYAVKSEKTTNERKAELSSLIGMRKHYEKLIEAETNNLDGVETHRKALAKAYRAHTKAYGPIHNSFGSKYLQRIKDPNRAVLLALENVDKKGNVKPAAIMQRSTIRTKALPENPTVTDAYVLSRNSEVAPDLADIAKVANTTEAAVRKELLGSGALYETASGQIQPSDMFLSGDVRKKYRETLQAIEAGNTTLEASANALKQVLPADIPYHQIEGKLGAPWVPLDVYSDYIAHMLNDNDPAQFNVKFKGGTWSVKFPSGVNNLTQANANYGVSDSAVKFTRLVTAAMRNQTITIKKQDRDGSYTDPVATAAANAAIAKMREDFGEWLWSDPQRRVDLEAVYNETRNNMATPRYDGSFLTMPGMALKLGNSDFDLRQHQKDAIWRAIVNKRSINAHEVGTGKSFTIAGIAIESRRYGIAKKPLILAHNANSRALANEINMMYPGARVKYIDKMDKKSAEQELRSIANDDWDAVVVPHSLVPAMTFRKETLLAMAAEDIEVLEAEIQEALDESEQAGDFKITDIDDEEKTKKLRDTTAKALVKQRQLIISNIEAQSIRSSAANAVPFEDLGIDMVLVDEVHEFKKPPISTRMSMKGLNTTSNNKSVGLNFMTRYIQSQNKGGNVHTFTGTVITNTLSELYGQMRYVMPEEMKEQGIEHWDGFFGSYMDEVQDVELSAAGEYEIQNRLAAFVNLPELRQFIGQYMDIVFADDMPSMQPRKGKSGKTMHDPTLTEAERNELENGRTEGATDRPYKKVITVTSEMTAAQKTKFAELQGQARAFRDASPKERMEIMRSGGPESPIIVEGNAAKASFDMRLVDGAQYAGMEGQVPDDPNSKATQVVNNLLEIYKSDKNANQVVFMGRGISTTATRSIQSGKEGVKSTKETYKTFSTMKDIIERLVASGIPREEIAVIDGSVKGDARAEVASKMNSSEVRIVLGNIKSMGVGVNMQRNLRAIHHMDAPWMPGDLEQGNGRGHRQGNQWNTVREYRYLTDRLDGRRWQILSIKQRFIKQFMKADGSQRSLEGDAVSNDEGGDMLETFAQAAGDPRILVRATLSKKLEKLQGKERMWTQSIVDAKRQIKVLEDGVVKTTDRLKQLRDTKAAVKTWREAEFTAKIDGKTYTKQKDADVAIKKILATTRRDGPDVELGTVKGKPLKAAYKFLGKAPAVWVDIDGYEASTEAETSYMAGIGAAARNHTKQLEKFSDGLEKQKSNIEVLKKVLTEPFRQSEQLVSTEAQIDRLANDIQLNPIPAPAWLREGAAVGTEVLHNGKKFEVTGHRYNENGWFVLSDTQEHVMEMPYLSVTDEQGIAIYEEREFESPEVIEKGQAQLTDADKVPATPTEPDPDEIVLNAVVAPTRRTSAMRLDRKVQRIEATAKAIARRWSNGPDIVVLPSIDDMKNVPEHLKGDISIRGMYFKNQKKIAVFANAVNSPTELERVLLHEKQHHNTIQALGDSTLSTFNKTHDSSLSRLGKLIEQSGGINAVLEKAGGRANYPFDYYEALYDRNNFSKEQKQALHAEEALSILAETEASGMGRLRTMARQIIAAIRGFLRRAGFKLLSTMPQDELLNTLSATRRQVFEQAGSAPVEVRAILTNVRLMAQPPTGDSLYSQGKENKRLKDPRNPTPAKKRKSKEEYAAIREAKRAKDREIAQKAIEEGMSQRDPTFKENAIKQLRLLGDSARRNILGALTRRQLVEVMSDVLPQAEAYQRQSELFDADRRTLQSMANDIAENWGKLSEQERADLSVMMHESTIAGIDPSLEVYEPVITKQEYDAQMKVLNRKTRAEIEARRPEGTGPLLAEKQRLKSLLAQEKNREAKKELIEALWEKMTPDAQMIYKRAKNHHNRMANETLAALEERIFSAQISHRKRREAWDTIKKEFESNRVTGPYFPLSRYGSYWVAVGEGDERTVDTFETQAEWENFITELKAQGADNIRSGKRIEDLFNEMNVPPEFMVALHELVDSGRSEESDPANRELRDSIHQLYLQSLPEMSARHHQQHRQKVRGFSNDALRSFADSAFHSAQQVARLRHSHKLDKILTDMTDDVEKAHKAHEAEVRLDQLQDLLDQFFDMPVKDIENLSMLPDIDDSERKRFQAIARMKEKYGTREEVEEAIRREQQSIDTAERLAEDPKTKAKASNYVSELWNTHRDMMNPQTSKIATLVNSAGFFWYLGITPAAAIVNTLQVPMVTLPFLGAKYGHKKATKMLNQTMKDFMSAGRKGKGRFTVRGNMTAEESAAFTQLVRSGVIDITQSQDLAGLAEDGIAHAGATYKFMKAISWSFHNAERMNREVSAMATYRLARADGKSFDEALQEASDMTWKSQYDYGSTNRARFMRGNWPRVLLQFKQYSASTTYLYIDTFRKAYRSLAKTPEEKAEAKRAFKSLLAIQFAMTGVLGMPLARTAGFLIEQMVNLFDEEDEFNYETAMRQYTLDFLNMMLPETLARNTAQALNKGVFDGFTPVSLHGRLSISELWWRSPNQELQGRDAFAHALKQVAGPAAGIVESTLFVGPSMIRDGHLQRGLEYMMPKAMKDVATAGRFMMEDARTLKGNLLLDTRFHEEMVKAMGFTPSRLSDRYDENNAKNRLQKSVTKQRGKLMREAVDARQTPSSADDRKLRDAIKRFNKRHPTYRIENKNISQSEASRKRANEQTRSGFRANNRLRSVLDDIDFAS